MSSHAKILSFSYDSAVATKGIALKSDYHSVRLIKEAGATNPGKDSSLNSVLIGKCIDQATRKLYVFYKDNYYGSAWIIEISIDNRVQKVVLYDKYNNIGFDSLYKIINPVVVNGRIIFTDNKNPIYQIDIERAKTSYYYGIGYSSYATTEWNASVSYATTQIVSAGKYFYKAIVANSGVIPDSNPGTWERLCLLEDAYYSMNVENFYFAPIPPKMPPIVDYISDDNRKINSLRQTLFQFAYRYIYIDWRKSTFSPASIVPLPQAEEDVTTGLVNGQISLNNALRIKVNLGGEEVRAIEVVARSSGDPTKWFLIDTIEKFESQEKESIVSKRSEASSLELSLLIKAPAVTNKSAPPAPVATAGTGLSSTNFTANWNASTGASGYYLDVATDSGFTTYITGYHNRDIGNVTSFLIRGVTSNTSYYYRLRAYDIFGLISSDSNTITVVIVIDAPVSLPATNVFGTGFTANWGAVSGATGYKLDVATDSGFTSFVAGYNDLDVGNVLLYNVTGLTVDSSYFYRVRAYNALGESVSSNTTSQRTGAPPSDPVATAATNIGLDGFTANWNASTGVAGYYLDVATDAGFVNLITGYSNRYVGNVLTYAIRGLSVNTTYYYRVRATDAHAILSNYSNTITTLTKITPPVTVAGSGIFSTGFTANWGAVSGATGYKLDVSTNGSFSSFVAGYEDLDVGNVILYNIIGLTVNTAYFYRVRAYTGAQESDNSNIISLRTEVPPSDPIATGASDIALTRFTANWDAAVGASGYYLDVATDSGFTSMITGYSHRNVGNVLSFIVLGLSSNTTYYYRIMAYDGHGITSNDSNTITVRTLLEAPVAITATGVGATGFTANWVASSGATGYRLDVATDSAFLSLVSGYSNLNVNSVTSYNVTGLALNTTYYFRVRAYNTESTSESSNTISQRTIEAPDTPVAIAATSIGSTSFIANWNIVSDASGYYIDVATDSGFTSMVSGYNGRDIGNVTSFLVRLLTGGTLYYYRLRAYDLHGLVSANSNIIAATTTTAATPPAPVALAATSIIQSGFTANWNASSGATGYRIDIATDSGFVNIVTGYNNLNVGNVLSYVVTGLSADTDYYYRIRAYNSNGSGSSSNVIAVTTTAATVTSLSLSPYYWTFEGVGVAYKKRIVVNTNGSQWGINFPSTDNCIKQYEIVSDTEVDLYFEGSPGQEDILEFWATGEGGMVYANFWGYLAP